MADSDPAAPRPLSSWKEIAAHFGRDVRTAQRWEKDEGLPVHRHPHKSRHSVYAYAHELDAWWRHHESLERDVPEPEAGTVGRRALLVPMIAAAGLVLAAVAAAFYLFLGAAGSSPTRAARAVWPLETAFETARGGDFDGDGRPDLAISGRDHRFPRIHRLQTATGGLGPVLAEFHYEDAVAANVTATADFNGDGIDDVVISTFRTADDGTRTSASYLVFGRRDWPGRVLLPRDADVRFETPPGNDDRLGGCASPGPFDLNHDGLHDIVLSGPEFAAGDRAASGAVFVLFGRAEWPRVMVLTEAADLTIVGSRTGEGFGTACAAGDWDGDGWPDLAVQAGEYTLWELRGARGRTYVFLGSPAWPSRLDAASDSVLRVDNPVPRSNYQHVALADVNGDGRADLVRSSPMANGEFVQGGPLRVWFGGRHAGVLTGAEADARIVPPPSSGGWGHALLAADFDTDGLADIVVVNAADGEAWLVTGRREWPAESSLADAGVRLYAPGTHAGRDSLAVIDTDVDGLPELLLPLGRDDDPHPSIALVDIVERLAFDVRPGKDRKLVLVPGPVVVRIAGDAIDVGDFDPQSMRLNGAAPKEARPGDDDGDGRDDLQLYFETSEMSLASPVATMTGRRRDGRLVGGTQAIEIVRRAGGRP